MQRLLLTALFVLGILCATADADVPGKMTLQGRLVDSTGTPIDSNVSVTFRIYDDKFGTTLIWQEVQPSVRVNDGRFDVQLGKVVPLTPTVLDGSVRFLSLQVGGGEESNASIEITSSAYAQRASHADTALVALNTVSNGWTDGGTALYPETITDSVGIGTSTPRYPLEVEGTVNAIAGHSLGSGLAIGVLGVNDNDGIGVMGTSSSGRGVYGISTTGFAGYFYGPKSFFAADVGVGTETPDEKMYRYTATSGDQSFLKVQSSHASNWGEAGLHVETPQNVWRLRMDDDSNNDIPDGALGLASQGATDEVMVFTEGGNVGVGTPSPSYRLDVESGTSGVRGTSTGGSIGVTGSSTSGTGVYGISSTGYGGYFSGPKHHFDGLLGLATTSPTHRLTVNGAIGVQSAGDTKFHINYYNGGLNISETTVQDYRLNIEVGGNVGIGTGNPQQKLHVAGNARIDGTLYTDGFEDNSIDKDDISDDAGVASSEAQGAFLLPSSWNDVRSRTITTPADGYVLALASFGFNAQHLASGVTSGLIGISTTPDSLPVEHRYQIQIPNLADYGDYKMPGACQRVFDLPAGTYTFYLVGLNTGDNFLTVGPVKLALLFVPTSYGTVSTAEVEENSGEAASGTVSAMGSVVDPQAAQLLAAHANTHVTPIETLVAEMQSLKARLEVLEQQ